MTVLTERPSPDGGRAGARARRQPAGTAFTAAALAFLVAGVGG